MPPTAWSYEPPPGARHRIAFDGGVEWIVLPAGRNWLSLLIHCAWLVFWIGLAVVVGGKVIEGPGAVDPLFLGYALLLWVGGLLVAIPALAWQLCGRHMLTVHEGALIYRWRLFFAAWTRRFGMQHVRRLESREAANVWGLQGMMRRDPPPFYPRSSTGTIKFDYGAKTERLVPGLDEAEGRMVVAWLARRLPAAAIERGR